MNDMHVVKIFQAAIHYPEDSIIFGEQIAKFETVHNGSSRRIDTDDCIREIMLLSINLYQKKYAIY